HDGDFRVATTLSACLEQRFRHRHNSTNGGSFKQVRDDVLVGGVAEYAFGQNDAETAARLEQLKTSLQKQDVRSLFVPHGVELFGFLELVAEVVLREHRCPLDRDLRSEWGVGEHDI